MKTAETCPSANNAQVASYTPMISTPNIAEALEAILLKMIYRISQEESHALTNVGNVA